MRLLRTNPAYRAYFAARITSVAGGAVAPIALAFAILELGGGGTGIAVVLAAEYGAWLLVMPVMGALADRTGDLRRLLVVSQIAAAGSQGVAAALIMTRTAEVWSLSLVAAWGAAAASLSGLAGSRSLARIVPAGQLVAANATFRAAQMAVAAAAPPAGGLLVMAAGPGPAIAWDAATFVLAAAWFARLPRMEGAPGRGGRRRRAELAEGWRAFAGRRWLVALTLAEACGHAAFMAAFILGPLLAQQRFGGAQDWGLINGALALGSSAGACLASRVRSHRAGWVIAAGGAAFAAGPGAMGAGLALPVVLVAVAAAGLLSGPGQVAHRAAVQIKVPDRQLGRVQGHVLLVESLPVPLVYLGAGTAADAYGAQPVIGACAVVMALAALAPLLVGEVRRLDLSVGSGAEGDAPAR
ncbi:MFS transporter [Spirillospora sp. NPDC127200]